VRRLLARRTKRCYTEKMTRKDAIAIIEQTLLSLDDEAAMALAEMAQSLAKPFVMRKLTTEELRLVEQSKEDFRSGRTLTADEYKREMNEFMTDLHAKYPRAR
jgi:hypothetical protein